MYEKLCKNSTLCAGVFVDYGSASVLFAQEVKEEAKEN